MRSLSSFFALLMVGSIGVAAPSDAHWEMEQPTIRATVSLLEYEVTVPGELGQLITASGTTLSSIEGIKVVGNINQDDLSLFNEMKQAKVVDLSLAKFIDLPQNFMFYNQTVEEVSLPDLVTIGSSSFGYCSALKTVHLGKVERIATSAFTSTAIKEIVLPEGLVEIEGYAFANSALECIEIPSTLNALPYNCFSGCRSLKTVTIPPSIKEIESRCFQYCAIEEIDLTDVELIGQAAFQSCRNLTKVTFGENLQIIGSSAFGDCASLTEVDIPESVTEVSSAFTECTTLTKVISRSLFPPYSDYAVVSLGNNTDLYVPKGMEESYRSSESWGGFARILPLDTQVSDINLFTSATLSDISGIAEGANMSLFFHAPDGHVVDAASLRYKATGTLSLGKFCLNHSVGTPRYFDEQSIFNHFHSVLIAEGPMKAEEVSTSLAPFYEENWYFISFPYDIKASSITSDNGSDFVIRKFDGYRRANLLGDNWQGMTGDSVLHAYEGYILHGTVGETTYTFPSLPTANVNNIFAAGDVVVPLKDYPSEREEHSSWNLVGNPYPSYFRVDRMEHTGPLTVYSAGENRYVAISPTDDIYTLHPGEAFFVQRPSDSEGILFHKEGRMTYEEKEAYIEEQSSSALRGAADRVLVNLSLRGEKLKDFTRVVFNDLALRSYERDKDAPKFTSGSSPLLYSVENGIRYAINERPRGEGEIQLGFYAPTLGNYTLSLASEVDLPLYVTDRKTGVSTPLSEGYTFFSEAGYEDDRLLLSLRESVDNSILPLRGHEVVVGSGSVRLDEPFSLYSATGLFIGHYEAEETAHVAAGSYLVKSQHVQQIIIVKP